jgi:hypothetical protein
MFNFMLCPLDMCLWSLYKSLTWPRQPLNDELIFKCLVCFLGLVLCLCVCCWEAKVTFMVSVSSVVLFSLFVLYRTINSPLLVSVLFWFFFHWLLFTIHCITFSLFASSRSSHYISRWSLLASLLIVCERYREFIILWNSWTYEERWDLRVW